MTRPLLGFSPETFARRRALALEGLRGGALVLPAAPVRYRSRETEHRYRPDSELFYLTGCTDSGVVAVLLDAPSGDRFILFAPRPDPKSEIWTGPRADLEEARELFGADAAYPRDELEERLPGFLEGSTRIFFRLGTHSELESLLVRVIQTARSRGARKGTGPRSVVDPGEVLDELRLRKDGEEIERIRRATALTVAAFREAMERARPGMGEWEVESILESAFRRGGAEGPAFPTIAGSGANACTLHYAANRHTLEKGEILLLDGGAQVDLYVGDVSRTFPCGGHFSDRQRVIYELVLASHYRALDAIRPGAPVSGVHDAVVGELTQGLVALGVLEGDAGELVAEGAYKPFFPHQTSHWLGLDVHDVGDYAREGESRKLEPGMVLTVEPGLYFPSSSGAPTTPFKGLGVRIENDVLVTEEGAENLTRSLPVDPEEIEAMTGGR